MMKFFHWLARQRIRRTLRRHAIPFDLWLAATRPSVLFAELSAVEMARLRVLATLFLQRKTLTTAHRFELTDGMAIAIAAQAVLPILNLGIDYYNGWVEIVVYPDAFRVSRDNTGSDGLVSQDARVLSGEAWLQGPVILSWQDVEQDLYTPHPGHNVVIHEFAHKLDMLNGRANGMPALHADMEISQWTEALSNAYHTLEQRLAHQYPPRINAYAATTPAEFFAVVSEYFFTAPDILQHHCAQVYQQLVLFYRQDPLQRKGVTPV